MEEDNELKPISAPQVSTLIIPMAPLGDRVWEEVTHTLRLLLECGYSCTAERNLVGSGVMITYSHNSNLAPIWMDQEAVEEFSEWHKTHQTKQPIIEETDGYLN